MLSEMRSHGLYDKYIFYHQSILTNKASIYLYKISEYSFNEFIFRYNNEYKFADKIDFDYNQYKIKRRDDKIDSIQDIPPTN